MKITDINSLKIGETYFIIQTFLPNFDLQFKDDKWDLEVPVKIIEAKLKLLYQGNTGLEGVFDVFTLISEKEPTVKIQQYTVSYLIEQSCLHTSHQSAQSVFCKIAQNNNIDVSTKEYQQYLESFEEQERAIEEMLKNGY